MALNRLQYDFIDFDKIVRWDSCSFAPKEAQNELHKVMKKFGLTSQEAKEMVS